jgi:hypothetical protein
MSLFSSSSMYSPISVHIGGTHPSNTCFEQQHVIVSNTGDGRSLGPGSCTLEHPEPGGEYPAGLPQTSRRPIPGGIPSLIGRRGLGHQQEEEEPGTARKARTEYGSPLNGTYRAMHAEKQKKKEEKRRKRQEVKFSQLPTQPRGGRGGGRKNSKRDSTRSAKPPAQHQRH